MKGACHNLFSGAGFTRYQDRGVGLAVIQNQLANIAQGCAVAKQNPVEARQFRQALGQTLFVRGQAVLFSRVIKNGQQPSGVKGFFQKTVGTLLDCLDGHRNVGVGRDQNNGWAVQGCNVCQQVQPGTSGHPYVGQYDVGAQRFQLVCHVARV